MKYTVSFGEMMVRITTPGVQKIRQSWPGDATISFAGSESNVAESLALQGCPSRFVTKLPKNDVAECCLAMLRGLGVDDGKVVLVPRGRMGAYYVEGGADQRASKVIYDREDSVFSHSKLGDYDWEEICKDADWFHCSGISPAISRETSEVTIDAVKRAKKMGLTVSFDMNYRQKLWLWDSSKAQQQLAQEVCAQILPYTDVLIGNIEDSPVVGVYTNDSVEHNPEFCRTMVSRYPNLKLIATILREMPSANIDTWGGILYDVEKDKQYVGPLADGAYAPWHINDIVDPIGVGDAFSAGLVYALKDPEIKDDLQYVLYYTLACSCLAHTIKGDCNYTTKEEVLALLQKGSRGSGRVLR